MNPRDPETAIKYIDETKAKYDGVIERMGKARSQVELSGLEREGIRYVQELFLVTPRLQEALILSSQKNRRRLQIELNRQAESTGSEMEQVADVVVSEMEKTTEEVRAEEPESKPVEKPKKTTRKRATTKKAAK